uniref:Putative sex-lethal interactor n=1 Tax=Corethrella appendiculata TaxID=1370023 RepID=U5EU45_9DIPT
MDEDEDSIVEEIPFYLSKTLADSLYVCQYPIKSMNCNFDKAEVTNCCVKPINQNIKIDYALQTDSKHYDAFKGEQFAVAADGKTRSKNEKPTFRSGTMDKQTFISSKPIDDVNRYMICIYQDKEIHGTPLTGIVQMRQTFSYFDKEDKRKKAEQKAENDADNEEDELKQVTVKFARVENEKIKKAREKSFNYLSQIEADEPWCETMWHPPGSTRSELEKQRLFTTNSVPIGDSLQLSAKEYMNQLINKEIGDKSVADALATNVVSIHKLNTLTLVDQLKVILRDAKVITFQQIMDLLPGNRQQLKPDTILNKLPIAGVLIKGNWIVKSEIIYPSNSISAINGVTAEQMINARDYILFQFTKTDYLDRQRLTIVTQLPTEEIKEILCSVAKLNAKKKWEMILPGDKQFEQKYPEIVERQQALWRGYEEKFSEMEKSPKRVRKKSNRDSKN